MCLWVFVLVLVLVFVFLFVFFFFFCVSGWSKLFECVLVALRRRNIATFRSKDPLKFFALISPAVPSRWNNVPAPGETRLRHFNCLAKTVWPQIRQCERQQSVCLKGSCLRSFCWPHPVPPPPRAKDSGKNRSPRGQVGPFPRACNRPGPFATRVRPKVCPGDVECSSN